MLNQQAFHDILATVCDAIGAGKACLMGYDSRKETLSCWSLYGLESDPLADMAFSLGDGLVGWIAQQDSCMVINDLQHSPLFDDRMVDILAENSLLATPIFYREQLLGVLLLAGKNNGQTRSDFDHEDNQKLSCLTPLLAQTIRLILDNSNSPSPESFPDSPSQNRLASIGELVAGIAHEIRNPLAGIMTTAETLKEDFDPQDSRKEYLERIINEINRMNHFLVKFFAFARPQKPQSAPTNLADVLDKIIELEGKNLQDKKVIVIRDYSSNLKDVCLDAGQIQQVFLNLILNAAQSMPQGGKLRLSIQPAGNMVHIFVADTGAGIAPEILSKIFDPFFTTKPKGVGLGLAVSQQLIKEHGGTIQVNSRVGQGTTFRVSLPVNGRF